MISSLTLHNTFPLITDSHWHHHLLLNLLLNPSNTMIVVPTVLHFTSYKAYPVNVKLLKCSTARAEVIGLKLIQCPSSKTIILLWPTYYMPCNPQCTFSPTALKHYLNYPSVATYHLDSLQITTSNGTNVTLTTS
jgi:hypothetical protein